MPRKSTLLLALLMLFMLAQGCSSPPAPDRPMDIVPIRQTDAPTHPAGASPRATASPLPALPPSPSPSALPAATPAPTSTPRPAQTPQPSPADGGRVTLADGFYYQKLDDKLKKRITGISYPADDKDCAVTYGDLRYIRLRHYDFEGNVQDGEMIVHKKLAQEVMEIFYALYQANYPMTSVRLVDDYGEPGDDTLSMEANNTSAFNYRRVTGSKTLSRHSYGAAIDVNPLYNPYIDGDRIAPENGADYADRSLDFPGKIDHDDICYKLFKKYGWTWGGDWSGDKDYQHFSKDIGF